MFLKYLESLKNYETKGNRTVDYVYRNMRYSLVGLLGIDVIILFAIIILAFLRMQLSLTVFFILFVLCFATLFLSLYLGYWHTNLTSRQRFVLFKPRAPLIEVERLKLINNYIVVSFSAAMLSAINLVFLTLNNFLLVNLNVLWDNAEAYLKYNNSGINYRTFHPLIATPFWNTLLFVAPVFVILTLLYSSYRNDIIPYEELRKDRFKRRFFRSNSIAHLFTDFDSKQDATLVLGKNSETFEPVVMKTNEQRLHTAIFGPIGSGKSASFAKNVLYQQIEASAIYFRNYAKFIKSVDSKFNSPIYRKKYNKLSYREQKEIRQSMYDEWFQKGLGAKYINGLYVNEPSGELIADTELMIQRAGFPKEMIWKIEPSNEKTGSMNIFDTDTGTAAGLVADLIRSFAEAGGDGGNTFFKDAENAYARNLTILMKSIANIENSYPYTHLNGNSPTFSDFSDLLEIDGYATELSEILRAYRNAYERHYNEKYLKPFLEAYLPERERWLEKKANEDYSLEQASVPFDEYFKEWKEENIAIINLFDKDIEEDDNYADLRQLYIWNRDANAELNILDNSYHYFSDAMVEDRITGKKILTHEVNISGMKNTIRKLSSSPLVRRIFFSQSTKNMDVFLKMGGFILVDSSRGKVDDTTSQMIGQITDIILQKAVFRRSAKTLDPFFAVVEDEYGWITTPATEKFLNQSRKFNVAVFGMYQNIEQLDATIGRDTVDALLNSYRNLFAFQGSSKRTTEAIIERAGKDKKLTRTQSRSRDNLIAGHDTNNESIREQIEEVDVATSTDLFRMEQFQFAGIHVVDDEESELVKVTPTPSFELDIFKEGGKNYSPVFGALDTQSPTHDEDLEAFKIWKKQSEQKFISQIKNNKITSDWFTFPELLVVEGYAIYRGNDIVLKDNTDKNIIKHLTKTGRVEYIDDDEESWYYLVKNGTQILPSDSFFLKSTSNYTEVETVEEKETKRKFDKIVVEENKQTDSLKDKSKTNRLLAGGQSSIPKQNDTEHIAMLDEEVDSSDNIYTTSPTTTENLQRTPDKEPHLTPNEDDDSMEISSEETISNSDLAYNDELEVLDLDDLF
uniref:TraM recognition domain-containing protein n=1 Tax=Streptococcus pluranimalium TaxID=82348 RepID=UPI003F68E5EF